MKERSLRIRFPSYFAEFDLVFLDEIVFHYRSFLGRTRSDVRNHLRLVYADEQIQWARCLNVLAATYRLVAQPRVDSKILCESRKTIFLGKTKERRAKNECPSTFGGLSIFPDLLAKLMIPALPESLNSRLLMAEVNSQISKNAISGASKLRITLSSNVRHVVMEAIKRGLLCVVVSTQPAFVLEVSGPLSVLRKTKIYGRAFLALLPFIVISKKFHILAFDFDNRLAPTLLQNGDPFPTEANHKKFDSQLEEGLAADLAVNLTGWKVDREPLPIKLGEHWMFPDFLLTSPCGTKRWFVELMGYTTMDYVKHKKTQMSAGLPQNFVFLISHRIAKHFSEFEGVHKIIVFKKTISIETLLTMLAV